MVIFNRKNIGGQLFLPHKDILKYQLKKNPRVLILP